MKRSGFKMSWALGIAALAAHGAAGCTSDSAAGAGGDVNTVEIALSVVPSGVQCVRVTATVGTQTVTPPLTTVAAGSSSANISIGQLPAGNATFTGAAFNLPCAMVTGGTVANWIAPSVMTTLVLGVSNRVTLTFLPNNAVSVNANFVPAPTDFGLGAGATRIRMADGSVREWGLAVSGAFELQPTTVSGLTDAVQVASGGQQAACALRATGGVVCWGSGPLLGVPPGTFTATPIPVTFPTASVKQISLGMNHGCAMRANLVDCWGDNSFGQFGNGTTTSTGAPVFTGFVAAKVVAGDGVTCFVGSDGTVFCAGGNNQGELGNGTTTGSTFPIPVTGVAGTVDVVVGSEHACALRGDGTVRCWGANFAGQLGDGTTIQRLSPVQVLGIGDAVRIAAGAFHTCVLRQMGTVSCWGKGNTLGDGTGTDRSTPADVPGLSGVVALDAHLGNHTCAILTDRTVRCWGQNEGGQVDGSLQFAAKPTAVTLQ